MNLPGTFHFVRCCYCGTLYQWPRLPWQQLQRYYEGDYDSYVTALNDEKSLLRRLTRRIYTVKMRRFVEQFCSSGVLLDIGCGTGVFLEEMQMSRKWQLYGVEPTLSAATYVRERFSIPVINERVESAFLPDETFDVVTMWNVFEHLENPRLALQKIHRSLKTEGILIIAVPNYESLSRVIFGKYWCGWDLPRHLFVFPRAVLIWLLNQNGFRVLDSRCFIGSYALFNHSLSFLQQDLQGLAKILLQVTRKIVRSYVGRFGFYPFQRLVEFTGLASIAVWVFQKTEV
ncbi:MAG: class I SAM-dependent methyltransferase [Chloroflexus sp.]